MVGLLSEKVLIDPERKHPRLKIQGGFPWIFNLGCFLGGSILQQNSCHIDRRFIVLALVFS